jgi:hypothetical protein
MGRGPFGPGYGFLDGALQELVSGDTRHAGELLAPLGVRFLVAAEGDLPEPVVDRLQRQLDIYAVPAGGLTIYRNPRALPVASVVEGEAFARAASSGALPELAALPELTVSPLVRSDGGWAGTSDGGTLYLGQQYADGWAVEGGGAEGPPEEAFGWAISASVEGGAVRIGFTQGWVRTIEMILLGLLWVVALWITRKPVSQ